MKRRRKKRFGRFLGVSLMAFALALSAVPAEGVIAEEGVQTVSEAGDFTIENGVLIRYNGSGGDVTIPEGVTEIGANAFYACNGLTSVTIPEGVTKIGYGVFQFCVNLTSVTIPDSVTEIGGLAFHSTGITSIAIPDNVTKIGECAFLGCRVTSITIPSNMAEIGKNVFFGSGLTSIIIPESVTKIEDGAFSACGDLISITVDGNNQIYDSRENCNAVIETGTNKLVAGCKDTIIPYGISEIGNSAFSGCSGLTSITIPDSVTEIGDFAFSGCFGLSSITIPDNVTEIGECTFSGCSGLTSITIPDNVTEIGDFAFSGCSGLTSITIPDNVTKIGICAINECENLTDITILNKNVTLYGKYQHNGFDRNYCILGAEPFGESIDYWPNNSKTITFRGYSNSTTQQFAKLLDEHKVEAELDTVTFIALDGGSTGDETKDNVAAAIQEGNNPPVYSGYDSALVSATVNGVKGTPILKVEAGSSIISGYISSNNLVDSKHDFDCVGYSLSLVDEAGNAVTEFTDCIVTLPLPTGWADKNGTFWIGSIKPDGQFERIAANVVDVQGQKCIQFTTNHFSEYGIVVETLKSGNQGDNTGNDDNGNGSGDSGNGDNGNGSGDTGNGDNGSGSGDAGNGDNGSGSGDAGNGDNGSSPGDAGNSDNGNGSGNAGNGDSGSNPGSGTGSNDNGGGSDSTTGNGGNTSPSGTTGNNNATSSGNSAADNANRTNNTTAVPQSSQSDMSYMPRTGIEDLLFLKNTIVYGTFLTGAILFILSFKKRRI